VLLLIAGSCDIAHQSVMTAAAGAAEAGLAGHLAIERVGAWLGSSVDIGHAVCSAQVGVGWPRLL